MKYDVFISYSTSDQTIVNDLSSYIEQHGLRCFVAHRNIPQGLIWSKAISEALNNSRLMLVVFSKAYNDSQQGDKEIELACEMQMPILTFRLSNDVYSGAKMYYLNNTKSVDATIYPKAAFGDVVLNALRLINIPPASTSATATPTPNTTPAEVPTPQPTPTSTPTKAERTEQSLRPTSKTNGSSSKPSPQPAQNQPPKGNDGLKRSKRAIIVLSGIAVIVIVILGVVLSGGNEGQQTLGMIEDVQKSGEVGNIAPTQTDDNGSIILHTITKDESIFSIAKKYNTTHTSIAELNPEVDFSKVRVGDKIRVMLKNDPVYHYVEEGDTYVNIAVKYQTTAKRILELNPDVDPTKIRVGQKLRVKGDTKTTYDQQSATKRNNKKVLIDDVKENKQRVVTHQTEDNLDHKIEEGENLYVIAKKYETTYKRIEELNPDLDPTKIQVGQLIRVKGTPIRKANQHKAAIAYLEQSSAPATTTTAAPSAENNDPVFHTIEEGDTFASLAVKYRTTSKRLQELNPDVDPTKLLIGLKIRVL